MEMEIDGSQSQSCSVIEANKPTNLDVLLTESPEDEKQDDSLQEDDDEEVVTEIEIEDMSTNYEENAWGQHIEEDGPDGVTFKSKTLRFEEILGTVKNTLSGKNQVNKVGTTSFKVISTQNKNSGVEYDMEVEHNCKEEDKCKYKDTKGKVVITVWGRNSHKECTLMINKHKKSKRSIVGITSTEIVKPFIDGLFNGEKVSEIVQFQNNTQRKHFKCSDCIRIFVREQDLKAHKTRIHIKSISKTLVLKDHRDVSNLTCVTCKKKFTRAVKMNNHNRRNHEESEQNYKCDSCKFKTSRSPEMNSHKRDIHKIKTMNISPNLKKLKPSVTESEHKSVKLVEQVENMDTSPPEVKEKNSDLIETDNSKNKNKIEEIIGKNNIVYKIPGDGLCAINATSAHIFEDESLGPTLRREMNKHIVKNQSYYINKGYCASINIPFERKIGNGPCVKFHDNDALYNWLDTSKKAIFMWSNSEDLLVIANMYKVDIKVITLFDDEKKRPSVNWIYPDKIMARQSVLTEGIVPTMTLLHKNDVHFDLVIDKSSRLAMEGNVRNQISVTTNDNEYLEKEADKPSESTDNDKDDCAKQIKELKFKVKELTVSHRKMEIEIKLSEERLKNKIEELEKYKQINKNFRDNEYTNSISETEKENNKNTDRMDVEVNMDDATKYKVTELYKKQNIEYNCTECDFQADESIILKKHINLKHNTKPTAEGTIKCFNCESQFTSHWNLMNHRKVDHVELTQTCKYNNIGKCKFDENTCWWKHTQNQKESIMSFKCSICNSVQETRKLLMLHKKHSHKEACKPCEKYLYSICNFKEHCWYLHERKPLISEAQNLETTPETAFQDFQLVINKKKPPSNQSVVGTYQTLL